jgi:hypothetical protein
VHQGKRPRRQRPLSRYSPEYGSRKGMYVPHAVCSCCLSDELLLWWGCWDLHEPLHLARQFRLLDAQPSTQC